MEFDDSSIIDEFLHALLLTKQKVVSRLGECNMNIEQNPAIAGRLDTTRPALRATKGLR
jgi:hypothetical protein